MPITWIVQKQTDDRRDQWNKAIRTACLSTCNEYHEIDIIPFSHDIIGEKPPVKGPIVVHGSTAIMDVAEREGWQPGVFRIYKESDTLKAIGDHYLNSDMKVLEVSEVVDYVKRSGMEFFFAKPDRDLKSFDGTVFDAEKFPFFMERVRQYANYDPETKICVSSIKNPEVEWRFVIVEKKVVAFSQYRVNRKLNVQNTAESHAIKFAEEISKFGSPHDVYVMDVCKINGQYKVIEYNTFNFSGLYACNIYAIVDSVNKYLENKNDA